MSIINLQATKREVVGKKVAALKEQGMIPAVIYGAKAENQNITIPENIFTKIFQEAGTSTLIDLQIDNSKPVKVLITDTQKDPVMNNYIHADFLQIDMNQEMTAEVALKFVGESPAIKSAGCMLVKSLEHVTVKCLPVNLPHDLAVDLGKLAVVDAHFTVADLDLPAGVVVVNDPSDVIAVVKVQKVQEEIAPVVAAAAVPVAGEAKKEEGAEADKTADKKPAAK